MGDEVEHADGAYNVEGLDRYNDANYLLMLLVRSSIGSKTGSGAGQGPADPSVRTRTKNKQR